MRIGLTGASGFVGGHLSRLLLSQGHSITALVRKNSKISQLADLDIKYVYGDVTDKASLKEFVEGIDVLIHAAAITSAPKRSQIMACNLEGTKNLINSCKESNKGLKRFLFISTQEAAGVNPSKTNPLTESTPLNPITPYGKSKSLAEDYLKKSGLPYTIVKPGAVYGPGDKDGRTFFELAQQRIFLAALFKNNYTMSYIENLIEGIALAVGHEKALNQSYYLTDNGMVNFGRIFRILRAFYGEPRIKFGVPRFVLFLVAALNTAYSAMSGQRQIFNLDKFKILTSPNCTVSSEKAKREFGYNPRFSAKEALLKTAKFYNDAGTIEVKS